MFLWLKPLFKVFASFRIDSSQVGVFIARARNKRVFAARTTQLETKFTIDIIFYMFFFLVF